MNDAMNDELHQSLFRPVDPPPGGLEALRVKLDAARARRRRVAVTIPALALAALALVMLRPARTRLPTDHPGLAAPSAAVAPSGGTTLTVLSESDRVVLALVSGAPRSSRAR